MKSTVSLIVSFTFLINLSLAQTNFSQYNEKGVLEQQIETSTKSTQRSKSTGSIFFYEDFSDSTLSNWTAVDQTNKNHNWIWSTSAPGGQYSTNIGPLNSASASNGFISLPADFYNTPMVGAPDPMNASITSGAISISPTQSVHVSFTQAVRYCCNSSNEIVLEVSTDGINWSIPYDANYGRPPSTAGANGEVVTIDVSADLATQSTAYLRFRFTGASHYFWMIDDVRIFDGAVATEPLLLDSTILNLNPTGNLRVHYPRVTGFTSSQFEFLSVAKNLAPYPQNNVVRIIDIFHDSTLNGAPGSGFTERLISDTVQLLPGARAELSERRYFLQSWQNSGYYRAMISIRSDSVPFRGIYSDSIYFTVDNIDTSLARENGNFGTITGPQLQRVGDKIGTIIGVDSSGPITTANSISLYIPNHPSLFGVTISPRIWIIDNTGIPNILRASSPWNRTIQLNDLGSWISLQIFPPTGLPPGDYLLGVEEMPSSFQSNTGVAFGREMDHEDRSWSPNTLIYSNDTVNPGWYSSKAVLGIRLGGWFTTAIPETEKKNRLNIYPNPSNGQIFINGIQEERELVVRDISGKQIHEQIIGKNSQNINLQFLKAGMYFLHFKGGEKEEVQKIIIQE